MNPQAVQSTEFASSTQPTLRSVRSTRSGSPRRAQRTSTTAAMTNRTSMLTCAAP